MLNVNICAIWPLVITIMAKIIHVTRYQSFVDTLYIGLIIIISPMQYMSASFDANGN